MYVLSSHLLYLDANPHLSVQMGASAGEVVAVQPIFSFFFLFLLERMQCHWCRGGARGAPQRCKKKLLLAGCSVVALYLWLSLSLWCMYVCSVYNRARLVLGLVPCSFRGGLNNFTFNNTAPTCTITPPCCSKGLQGLNPPPTPRLALPPPIVFCSVHSRALRFLSPTCRGSATI